MEGHSQNPLQTQAVTLPANRAFVIQFEGAPIGQTTSIAGRVEHVTSGSRTRFSSWEELQHFIIQELTKLDSSPPLITEEEI